MRETRLKPNSAFTISTNHYQTAVMKERLTLCLSKISGQSGRRVAAAAATATLLPQFFQDMSLYLVACTHTGSSEWKCDQQPGFWWGGQWIGPLWGVHWEPTCDALSPTWESNDGVLTSGRHWGSQKMGKPRPKNFSVDRDKRASTLPGWCQDPQKSLVGAAEMRNGR